MSKPDEKLRFIHSNHSSDQRQEQKANEIEENINLPKAAEAL